MRLSSMLPPRSKMNCDTSSTMPGRSVPMAVRIAWVMVKPVVNARAEMQPARASAVRVPPNSPVQSAAHVAHCLPAHAQRGERPSPAPCVGARRRRRGARRRHRLDRPHRRSRGRGGGGGDAVRVGGRLRGGAEPPARRATGDWVLWLDAKEELTPDERRAAEAGDRARGRVRLLRPRAARRRRTAGASSAKPRTCGCSAAGTICVSSAGCTRTSSRPWSRR